MKPISRRTLLAASSALAAGSMLPSASFAAPTKMKLSVAFPEADLRGKAFKEFADALKADIEIEPHWSNSLFKQGTELVALQRGNLELCDLAPADISKQLPAWSLMTSAYLFRDYAHLKNTFASDIGKEFIGMAREKLGLEVIRPVYFGARQVNLKPDKTIKTPADMAGIKLRMPPGEYWQFLGESIGANPTPVAFSELYTALQTGVVDGQDNPLVSGRTMKFYEVTSQFVLTRHVLGYDMLTVAKKVWDGMSKDLQTKFRATADKVFDASAAEYDKQEGEAIEFFKSQGKKVYQPDQNAFREFAQKKYVARYGNEWPKGALEKINAIK
ncbi:MAG: TRAP transporter substrate-binding protein DctP [Proteobacteria bacterium]|nr:TRAP transporter substrate-binding protein DctP [Pseudomonadota bacterium]